MTTERRENNEKIMFFMGQVTQYMKNDEEWKKEQKKQQAKTNTASRLNTIETQQKWIIRIGGFVVTSTIAFFTRGYWMKH